MSGVAPSDDLAAAGFRVFSRAQWAALAGDGPGAGPGGPPPAGEAVHPVPPDELDEVYRPICRLLAVMAAGRRERAGQVAACLGTDDRTAPFVVGVTGGVAAGKSTVAGRLRWLLEHRPGLESVDVLSTDSFLLANDELAARGLAARKGFPESYDRPRLVAALASIREGVPVEVPVYSHRSYDIVPGRRQVVAGPDVLIVEGLHLLRTGPSGAGTDGDAPLVSDLLDWTIYLDAAEADLVRWHRQRLLDLHRAGSREAPGFLGWFCSLSEDQAGAVAEQAWWGINSLNLREHIAPTRVRASMILHKGPDHRVNQVRVRTR